MFEAPTSSGQDGDIPCQETNVAQKGIMRLVSLMAMSVWSGLPDELREQCWGNRTQIRYILRAGGGSQERSESVIYPRASPLGAPEAGALLPPEGSADRYKGRDEGEG